MNAKPQAPQWHPPGLSDQIRLDAAHNLADFLDAYKYELTQAEFDAVSEAARQLCREVFNAGSHTMPALLAPELVKALLRIREMRESAS